jgi:hypothetical protein
LCNVSHLFDYTRYPIRPWLVIFLYSHGPISQNFRSSFRPVHFIHFQGLVYSHALVKRGLASILHCGLVSHRRPRDWREIIGGHVDDDVIGGQVSELIIDRRALLINFARAPAIIKCRTSREWRGGVGGSAVKWSSRPIT